MKKEPPDVIVFDTKKKVENPLDKYIYLLIWAGINNDLYLIERARQRIWELALQKTR